jgi:hypothetical protein
VAKGDLTNGVFGDVLREEEAKKQPGRGAKGGRKGPQEATADAFDAIAPVDPDAEPPRSTSGGGSRVKLKSW